MNGRDMISYLFGKPTLAAGEGWRAGQEAREAGKRQLQLSRRELLPWKNLFGDMLWDGVGEGRFGEQTWDPAAVGCCMGWRVSAGI